MVSEESPQLAAHIAQALRDAGLSCGMVNLVPTKPAVLRRDRTVIGIALLLLTVLA